MSRIKTSSFLHLFKKCDKIHNFMHYVQILLKLMPSLNKDVIKKIRIWARVIGTGPGLPLLLTT
jgi:hypothetical protein